MDRSHPPLAPKLTPERVKASLLKGERTFVYQFGRGVGFCADYILLLTCMIKCLQFNYAFRLGATTRPRGFATRHGWNDYFVPFFAEAHGPLLHSLNVTQFPFARRLPFLKALARPLLKSTTTPKSDLFMFDDLGTLTHLSPPMFGTHQSFISACKELMDMMWVLNEETRAEVDAHIAAINPPKHFSAVHIRRGDKVTEYPYVPISKYVDALLRLEDEIGAVFVATDDHSVVSELAEQLPHHVFSSGATDLAGYDQQTFNRAQPSERRNQTIRFLAEFEMMKRATHFIGDPTTNVAALASFFRGEERVTWVNRAQTAACGTAT
jgi:hypothetical protein